MCILHFVSISLHPTQNPTSGKRFYGLKTAQRCAKNRQEKISPRKIREPMNKSSHSTPAFLYTAGLMDKRTRSFNKKKALVIHEHTYDHGAQIGEE